MLLYYRILLYLNIVMKKIPNKDFFTWAEAELQSSGKIRFRVKGNSMYPLLRNNEDEVSVGICNMESLRKGDIVLFHYRGQYILHRFIAQKNGYLLMQGDNLPGCKEQCRTCDVIGIVMKIYRRKSLGGTFTYAAVSPHSPKWNAIVFLWKIKCRVYVLLSSLKRKTNR